MQIQEAHKFKYKHSEFFEEIFYKDKASLSLILLQNEEMNLISKY